MAALNLNANLPVYIQWPDNAALTLIQHHRAYQPLFTTTRKKWNALKAGYENLERLINRNPDDYPSTRTPSLHDERFYQELSDEFWRVEPLSTGALGTLAPDPPTTTESAGALILDLPTTESAGALILDLIITDIRRRYSHAKPIKPIRIQNRFSYSNLGETTTSGERCSPVRSPDNDDDNMDFQYNHEDNDLSFQDINDDDNEYGSIGPQYYNDEMEDDDQSFDNEEEEETDNEYNSEKEEENDNEYNRDEEEDDDNGDNNKEEEEEGNNEEEEERNNDEEERNDNEEEEIHQIVEALDEDNIPSCNGEFAPYFDNYTTTALFSYEDLVDIIHNPQFEPTHVVKNICRFQSWRKRLPLLPIITKPIQILPKKTLSTLQDSKLSYQLSISDIIWRVLNNPMLMKHMYFGPGVNSETKSEYWHGTLWGESPLFGQHEIIISEVIYQSGDFVYYHDNGLKKLGRLRAILKDENGNYELRVQLILNYDDLSGNIKGLSRRQKVTIMMTYKHQIIPEDYISVRNPPSSMPVYKLFLDLYYDDFGTFRNFMVPFVSEIKKFEKGKIMTVQGQDAWIIAGLGLVTADLPQGNDMAGVLRYNANKGCRTCTTKKESLSTYNQDSVTTLCYHHITNEEISKISQESVNSKRGQLCTEYGLRSLPSILDKLKRERHLQTPQDIYHATAGKIGRLLKLTCELFSQEREDDFVKIWKNFEIPKKWSRLPNPISHYNSFMMSDLLRLAMIMLFLLNRFLKESSLKNNEAATIRQRIDVARISLLLKAIISCWVQVAKTMKAVFNKEFTLDRYKELQLCLKEEFLILPKVFASFVNLPNIHINMHLLMHAKTFGTLVNSQVSIKEIVHRIFKGMVSKTNCKTIDLDLLKRYNTLFAIRHLADGGIDPRLNRSCTGFTSSNFDQLFSNWYVTEDKYLIEEQIQNDDVKITSPVNFISNISLKKECQRGT
ncbi:hypothetical protein GLOIN_2v1790940 [Rhizophagus irregularis DAOM 181602=DAOM 197198]|nr:hypothetical protein GLOIN_2v1790940 [Rhizophagus irregularis DAOM 181602=DAOM 197198]